MTFRPAADSRIKAAPVMGYHQTRIERTKHVRIKGRAQRRTVPHESQRDFLGH